MLHSLHHYVSDYAHRNAFIYLTIALEYSQIAVDYVEHRKVMLYLMMHSTHFIDGYMVLDI